jgi:hypothetical protein
MGAGRLQLPVTLLLPQSTVNADSIAAHTIDGFVFPLVARLAVRASPPFHLKQARATVAVSIRTLKAPSAAARPPAGWFDSFFEPMLQ